MKRIFFIAIFAVATYSCGSNGSKSTSDPVEQLKELEIVDISIDSLTADPSIYANQTVRFSAMVDHVCKHTGQKITVVGSLPNSKIKVMASQAVPNFDPSLNGLKVEVVGVVKGMATESVESCEVDSAKVQPLTYAVECNVIKTL